MQVRFTVWKTKKARWRSVCCLVLDGTKQHNNARKQSRMHRHGQESSVALANEAYRHQVIVLEYKPPEEMVMVGWMYEGVNRTQAHQVSSGIGHGDVRMDQSHVAHENAQ